MLRKSHDYWPAICLVLAAFFGLATQRWMGFEQGSQFVVATSSPLYVEIARAAPTYPTSGMNDVAERALPHYGVGLIAKSLGVSVDAAYTGTIIVLMLLILFMVNLSLAGLSIEPALRTLLLASVFLNPYAFRYYLLAKPMFTDLIFVLGLSSIVLGLFRSQYGWVLGGLLIAVFGQSTVLLILPGTLFGIWAFLGPRLRILKMGTALVTTVVALMAIEAHATTIGKPLWPIYNEIGLLFSMKAWVDSPDFSLTILSQHVLRSILPLLIPLAFLFGTTAVSGTSRKLKTPQASALLLIVLGIFLAALLPNPAIQQNSQGRYSAYAIVVMTLLVGWLWSGSRVQQGSSKVLSIALGVILAGSLGAASLHHMYTLIGPANVADFGMFHVATCEMLAIVSWYLFRSFRFCPTEQIACHD